PRHLYNITHSATVILSPLRPTISFLFNHTPPTHTYTLSLHDALPIFPRTADPARALGSVPTECLRVPADPAMAERIEVGHRRIGDRKSTRLNSSHLVISYAVFCLKKKKKMCEMMKTFVTTPLDSIDVL